MQSDSNAIAVPHPLSKYTFNIYDSNDIENTLIQLGQAIPNAITQYSSQEAVWNFLNSATGVTVDPPIYLRHEISNDVVVNSYVEFVVTEDMVNDFGVTAGTYSLRGEAVCEWDSVNLVYTNCGESEYYSFNAEALETAFGNYCYELDDQGIIYFTCNVGNLRFYASTVGFIGADNNDMHFGCSMDVGISACMVYGPGG